MSAPGVSKKEIGESVRKKEEQVGRKEINPQLICFSHSLAVSFPSRAF